MRYRAAACSVFFGALLVAAATSQTATNSDGDWPAYGGTLQGQRYTSRTQINRNNVKDLRAAWVFHTGTLDKVRTPANARGGFEATPVLWNETLYFDTPFDEMFAVDAVTGTKRWSFDPGVNRDGPIYIAASRGVALWHANKSSRATSCKDRVFVATLDRRLMAVDAISGQKCREFGAEGTVDLLAGVHAPDPSGYFFTSPPTVVGNVVVLGSSVADNRAVDVASGVVRGFDAVTGRQLWAWEPIPWAKDGDHFRAGSANTWTIISADIEHGLVFLPTGSASTDGYGGRRVGDDRDANSIVALDAATGKKIWSYQLVHHDLWDYDLPSQPLLFNFHGKVPAVAVLTKAGMVYVLNRLTGEPLFPITERPVPASTIEGEHAWPTQPFSSIPALMPQTIHPDDIDITDPAQRDFCQHRIAALVNQGPFTPPSVKGTLLTPGPLGGANWGSGAFDPTSGEYFVHLNSAPWMLRVLPAKEKIELRARHLYERVEPESWKKTPLATIQAPDSGEISKQEGTPYWYQRDAVTSQQGLPCAPKPWGSVVAINLNSGSKGWTTPLGTMVPGEMTGSIGMGGPIVSRGGLIFIGGTSEATFRALDSASGKVLWEAPLPAPGNATPMSYQIRGRQYVVIAAGGEGMISPKISDAVVAFALPSSGSEGKSQRPSRHNRRAHQLGTKRARHSTLRRCHEL